MHITHDWNPLGSDSIVIGRQGANYYDISVEFQTPLKENIKSANKSYFEKK